MTVKCTASVENPVQRENLCECLIILGASPSSCGDNISVIINKEDEKSEQIIGLFKHYIHHTIVEQ